MIYVISVIMLKKFIMKLFSFRLSMAAFIYSTLSYIIVYALSVLYIIMYFMHIIM